MQTAIRTVILTLAFCAAWFTSTISARAAIESNFDDQVYPGEAGNGWVGGWQHSVGTPVTQTDNPLDGATPYIRLDATGAATRNFMRQFESGGGVNPAAPYYVRWKFRLIDVEFEANFTVFNDRAHFFGRSAPRLAASTDASINWSIMATGDAHATGASAGKTFWIFDNVEGNGTFNLANHVDTLVPLVPGDIYAFEVLVDPQQLSYTVAITNETSSASFRSGAPHRFRNLSAVGEAHTHLHFGVQGSAAAEVRGFDFDAVSIVAWPGPLLENVIPNAYAIHSPTGGIHFDIVALDPVAEGDIGLTLNGLDVSAQLVITGPETHRSVSYSDLVDDAVYEMTITATNASGARSLTRTFYTATAPFTLYDSEGFTSDVLYPVGPLQSVTHGNATWEALASESADIVNIGDPQGKVLERLNMGAARGDYVHFQPISSGTIIIEFDAWVSFTSGRTFDISLHPLGSSTTTMASFVGWGAVAEQLAYYDNANWQPAANLETDWHHCKLVHYLSGPAAGRYDILVNDIPVAEKILWRNVVPGTPLSRVRYASDASAPALQYGRIDNLVIIAAPEDPNAFPPPAIVNFSPVEYTVIRPEEGLQFEVTSALPITASDITVLVNGTDVSDELTVTGGANQLTVSYDGLLAGRQIVEISAVNGAGPVNVTRSFYATVEPLTIFDADGFNSETVYPLGFLQAIEHDGSIWAPAVSPSEIVDAGGAQGKALRRMQMGTDQVDYLNFPPVASGILTIEVDARASVINARTMDFCLMQITGGNMASFLGWGTVLDNFAYYNVNSAAWIPMTQPGTDWHRYTTINYLSGPHARTFDLKVDGVLVGEKLPFRHATPAEGTSLARIRVGAIRGTVPGEYGEIDNLVLTVHPLPMADADPVSILNPAHTGTVFSFAFVSQTGISHVVEYTDMIGSNNWTTLETIPGDGTQKTVTHNNPPPGALYYRVRSHTP
ncbi:MAG: hypothetical protein IH623_00440 [Verrucomicrobia bacterium]|nr:hypothetical protein [Verrucomicrobiota bacterium]